MADRLNQQFNLMNGMNNGMPGQQQSLQFDPHAGSSAGALSMSPWPQLHMQSTATPQANLAGMNLQQKWMMEVRERQQQQMNQQQQQQQHQQFGISTQLGASFPDVQGGASQTHPMMNTNQIQQMRMQNALVHRQLGLMDVAQNQQNQNQPFPGTRPTPSAPAATLPPGGLRPQIPPQQNAAAAMTMTGVMQGNGGAPMGNGDFLNMPAEQLKMVIARMPIQELEKRRDAFSAHAQELHKNMTEAANQYPPEIRKQYALGPKHQAEQARLQRLNWFAQLINHGIAHRKMAMTRAMGQAPMNGFPPGPNNAQPLPHQVSQASQQTMGPTPSAPLNNHSPVSLQASASPMHSQQALGINRSASRPILPPQAMPSTPVQNPASQPPNAPMAGTASQMPIGGFDLKNVTPEQRAKLEQLMRHTTDTLTQVMPRADFERAIQPVLAQGGSRTQMLQLDGRKIDLYQLWQAVRRAGGPGKVNTEDKWSMIGGELGFVQFPASDKKPATCGPGIAVHLKNVWQECLARLDQQYIHKIVIQNFVPTNPLSIIPPVLLNWAQNDYVQVFRLATANPADLRAKGMQEEILQGLEVLRNHPQFNPLVAKLRAAIQSRNGNGGVPQTPQSGPQMPVGPHATQPGGQVPQNPTTGAAVPIPQPPRPMGMSASPVNPGGMNQSVAPANKLMQMRLQIEHWRTETATLRPPQARPRAQVSPEQLPDFRRVLDIAFAISREVNNLLPNFLEAMGQATTVKTAIEMTNLIFWQKQTLNQGVMQFIVTLNELQNLATQLRQIYTALLPYRNNQASAPMPGPPQLPPQPPPPTGDNRPIVQPEQIVPSQENATAKLQRPPSVASNSKKPPNAFSPPGPSSAATPPRASATTPVGGSASTPSAVSPSFNSPKLKPAPKKAARRASIKQSASGNAARPAASSSTPTLAPATVPAESGQALATSAPIQSSAAAAPAPASSTAASQKRPREEEATTNASAPVATEPPVKKLKAEFDDGPAVQELVSARQKEADACDTTDSAVEFLTKFSALLSSGDNTSESVALQNNVHVALDLIMKGVSVVPDLAGPPNSASAFEAQDAFTSNLVSSSTATGSSNIPADDFCVQFIDFTGGDEDEPTPGLSSSGSTGPSPASHSEADAAAHTAVKHHLDAMPLVKMEDDSQNLSALGPFRLGALNEIDSGGESAHYTSMSDWKWEESMSSNEEPWAIFSS